MNDQQIKHMVDRFLSWKLPADFRPDAGISFKAEFNEHTAHPMKHEPSGTNLFNADQAERMVRYLLEGLPLQHNLEGWQPIETADKTQERLTLGIFRSGKLEEIHVGGYRHAYNDDEEPCWWSDQCDDEIVPTHWMPDLSAAPVAPAASLLQSLADEIKGHKPFQFATDEYAAGYADGRYDAWLAVQGAADDTPSPQPRAVVE